MTEIKVSPEVDRSRPRLFFHATRSKEAINLMPEMGLLADKYTLTPSLELALDFVDPGRGFLTFWYPGKQEVIGKDSAFLLPSTPLNEQNKKKLSNQLLTMEIDDFLKGYLIGLITKSKTYLPPSRLGAIAQADSQVVSELSNALPSDSRDILKKYTKQYPLLMNEIGQILDKTKITFFNPKLDKELLAKDLIRTSLEHGLLSIGRRLDHSIDLKEDKDILNSVSFDDAVYERYRTMLLTAIERQS
jgi:hypothetical protein